MAGITLSDLSDILEKIIRPAVEDQTYAGTLLWNMFGGYEAKGATKSQLMPRINMGVMDTALDNTSFYIPILTGHSAGAVAIPEGGTLVTGKPKTGTAQIATRYQTGTFQIDKQTLAIKDRGVAVKQLDFFMQQNSLAMCIDLNRQGYGDGSGQIGTTNAGATSTTLVLAPSVNGDIDYTRYLPAGTQIKIGSNSATSVTAVTGLNTVTIANSQTWSQGDAVKKLDGAGNVAVELDGLAEAISNSAVYQSLDPSSVPSWKPGYVDTTAKALAGADIDKAFIQANRTGNVKYIIMNANEWMKYGELYTGQVRLESKDILGGGWQGLDYMKGKAQVVLDYDCPDDRIYFLSPDYWTLAELSPFDWEKGTDGVLLRVQGTLNYEAVATWFGNFGCFKRSANAVLTNRS